MTSSLHKCIVKNTLLHNIFYIRIKILLRIGECFFINTHRNVKEFQCSQSVRNKKDDPENDKKFWLSLLVIVVYCLVVSVVIILVVKAVENIITSINHPVRSTRYDRVNKHEAPGMNFYISYWILYLSIYLV